MKPGEKADAADMMGLSLRADVCPVWPARMRRAVGRVGVRPQAGV